MPLRVKEMLWWRRSQRQPTTSPSANGSLYCVSLVGPWVVPMLLNANQPLLQFKPPEAPPPPPPRRSSRLLRGCLPVLDCVSPDSSSSPIWMPALSVVTFSTRTSK